MSVRQLSAILPNADDVLELDPEELAGVLLRVLQQPGAVLHFYNFLNDLNQTDEVYPRAQVNSVKRAIIEAWIWLENNGLIAPGPGDVTGSSRFVTRKGLSIDSSEAFAGFQQASKLPRELLHPRVSSEAWPNFIRGRYDTAVFEAFKEVEIAVRTAGAFDDRQVGTTLMRAAFDKNTGPLRDPDALDAEREALAHLFSGAIGSYKNPHSHRRVGLLDASEAGQLLMLASHLLRIVDDRAQRATSGPN